MTTLARGLIPLLAALLLTAPVQLTAQETPARPLPVAGKDGIVPLEWEDLIPADFDPERLYVELNLDAMDDTDPRAEQALRKLREAWDAAPTVAAFDGKRVRLPGFVVPLESDGRHASLFLLVPYVGACIHVPPPPANQMVLVRASGKGVEVRQLFDAVWVTGLLRTERSNSELGRAGYSIETSDIRPYDGDKPPY